MRVFMRNHEKNLCHFFRKKTYDFFGTSFPPSQSIVIFLKHYIRYDYIDSDRVLLKTLLRIEIFYLKVCSDTLHKLGVRPSYLFG